MELRVRGHRLHGWANRDAIPVSSTDAIAGNSPSVTASTGGYTTSASIDGNNAVWVFADPLPAGSSGQMTFTLSSIRGTTPNASTYTPTATFSVTNPGVAPVSASAAITVNSTSEIRVTKKALGVVPGEPEPLVGSNVTYEVYVNTPAVPYGANLVDGYHFQQDVVTTDELPPKAVFVSATGGGDYDPNAHTVTWGPEPKLGQNDVYRYRVTVKLPSGRVTADNDPNNPSDEVTITVHAEGKPWLRLDDPAYVDDASATHGSTDSGGGPGVETRKYGYYEWAGGTQSSRNGTGGYLFTVGNTGNVSTDFSHQRRHAVSLVVTRQRLPAVRLQPTRLWPKSGVHVRRL